MSDHAPYTEQQILDLAEASSKKMIPSLQNYIGDWERLDSARIDLVGAFVCGALTATAKLDSRQEGARAYQYSSGHGAMLNRLAEIKAEIGGGKHRTISLDKTLADKHDGEITLGETIADPRAAEPIAAYLAEDEAAQTRSVIGSLSDREREILSLRYIDGRSVDEVAEIVGVSRGRVSQIVGEATEKARAAWK
jgi:RNA polymerase sigma factor (sigma-70 family)